MRDGASDKTEILVEKTVSEIKTDKNSQLAAYSGEKCGNTTLFENSVKSPFHDMWFLVEGATPKIVFMRAS